MGLRASTQTVQTNVQHVPAHWAKWKKKKRNQNQARFKNQNITGLGLLFSNLIGFFEEAFLSPWPQTASAKTPKVYTYVFPIFSVHAQRWRVEEIQLLVVYVFVCRKMSLANFWSRLLESVLVLKIQGVNFSQANFAFYQLIDLVQHNNSQFSINRLIKQTRTWSKWTYARKQVIRVLRKKVRIL